MKVIETIKKLESVLKKAQNIDKFVDYEKIKSSVNGLLDNLLNNNIIDQNSYDMLVDRLYKSNNNKKYASLMKTASIKNQVIVMMLLACISLIHAGEEKNIPPEPKVPGWEQRMKQSVSDNDVLKQAFLFVKKYEGQVLGNVYDKDGKVIARNVHLVYDDKIPMGKPNKHWDGKPNTLDDFIKNCKGKPTIGYGTTNNSVVNKGYITNQEAVREAGNFIRKVITRTKRKIGADHWNKLNINQRVALVSLYYNTGVDLDTPKLIGFIQAGDYKNAAKEFLDIVKSEGKVVEGLVNRRKEEAKLFLTPVK